MITKVKNRHLKTFEKEFGREAKNIFLEALGDIKLEEEVKKIKSEGKSIDTLSCDEFKKRFSKFTGYEIKRMREIEKIK